VVSVKVEREDAVCPVCGACIALCEKDLAGNLVPTGHVAQVRHTIRMYRITTPGAEPPGWVLTNEEYARRLQAGNSLLGR